MVTEFTNRYVRHDRAVAASAALAPLAALIVGALTAARPAYAAEVYTPNADGVISVRGHG